MPESETSLSDTTRAPSGPADTARTLSPAAERALSEAAARRAAQEQRETELARTGEINGRGGKDPVRYNDWEIKGLTSDF
jgi:hypothetical protein